MTDLREARKILQRLDKLRLAMEDLGRTAMHARGELLKLHEILVRMACTGEHPSLMVDVDGKAKQMVNLQPKVKSGDLVIHPVEDRLVADRLSKRALNPDKPPEKQPTGYVTTVDILNDIVDGEPEYDKYKTIILDSGTRLVAHLTRLLIYHRGQGKFGKKAEDDMNWPSWGSYLANLQELFNVMCSHMNKNFICTVHMRTLLFNVMCSHMNKNFICTVHMRTLTKKVTSMIGPNQVVETEKITGYKPLVDGQMRDQLAGFFNEVYYMDVVDKSGQEAEYRFRTRGAKYDARTSLNLDEFVPADLGPILREAGG